jgi:hypothetical protein
MPASGELSHVGASTLAWGVRLAPIEHAEPPVEAAGSVDPHTGGMSVRRTTEGLSLMAPTRVSPAGRALVLGWTACLLTPTAGLAQEKAPRHLEEAREFIQHLSLERTEYRHRDTVVRWKGTDGAKYHEARTDCSGFLDALLAHAYGLTRADFKKWTGRARPLAATYYGLIEQGKGFTRVAKVADVLPGDIITIRYPAGSDDTGHIMLVAGVPRARTASAPVKAGTTQWTVRVIDSSKSGHGKTDTRYLGDGEFAGGVGEGVFRLYTDPGGQIIGYAWSTVARSKYRSQAERPLLIGRYDATFKP